MPAPAGDEWLGWGTAVPSAADPGKAEVMCVASERRAYDFDDLDALAATVQLGVPRA